MGFVERKLELAGLWNDEVVDHLRCEMVALPGNRQQHGQEPILSEDHVHSLRQVRSINLRNLRKAVGLLPFLESSVSTNTK